MDLDFRSRPTDEADPIIRKPQEIMKGAMAMKSENTYNQVVRSDPMEDHWERDLDERTPFGQKGSRRHDFYHELPELPF
jgi:hypothetical protein